MRKIILGSLIILACFLGLSGCSQEKELTAQWYTLENIEYDAKERALKGSSSQDYVGEMIVILSESIDDKNLETAHTVKVHGGPAMTRSLPPQLVGCDQIEIVK